MRELCSFSSVMYLWTSAADSVEPWMQTSCLSWEAGYAYLLMASAGMFVEPGRYEMERLN